MQKNAFLKNYLLWLQVILFCCVGFLEGMEIVFSDDQNKKTNYWELMNGGFELLGTELDGLTSIQLEDNSGNFNQKYVKIQIEDMVQNKANLAVFIRDCQAFGSNFLLYVISNNVKFPFEDLTKNSMQSALGSLINLIQEVMMKMIIESNYKFHGSGIISMEEIRSKISDGQKEKKRAFDNLVEENLFDYGKCSEIVGSVKDRIENNEQKLQIRQLLFCQYRNVFNSFVDTLKKISKESVDVDSRLNLAYSLNSDLRSFFNCFGLFFKEYEPSKKYLIEIGKKIDSDESFGESSDLMSDENFSITVNKEDKNIEIVNTKTNKIVKNIGEVTINSDDQYIEEKLQKLKNLKENVLLFFRTKQYSASPKNSVFEILTQLQGKRHSSQRIFSDPDLKNEEEKKFFQNYLFDPLQNTLDWQVGFIEHTWKGIVNKADYIFCNKEKYQYQEDSLKKYCAWFFEVIEHCPRKIDSAEKINVIEQMNSFLYRKKILKENYDNELSFIDIVKLLKIFNSSFKLDNDFQFNRDFFEKFFGEIQKAGENLIVWYCQDKQDPKRILRGSQYQEDKKEFECFYKNVRSIMEQSLQSSGSYGDMIESDVLMADPKISLSEAIKNKDIFSIFEWYRNIFLHYSFQLAGCGDNEMKLNVLKDPLALLHVFFDELGFSEIVKKAQEDTIEIIDDIGSDNDDDLIEEYDDNKKPDSKEKIQKISFNEKFYLHISNHKVKYITGTILIILLGLEAKYRFLSKNFLPASFKTV